jgi:hypothetical protein
MLGGLWRALFAGRQSWDGKLTWKSAGVGGIPAGSSANGGTVLEMLYNAADTMYEKK